MRRGVLILLCAVAGSVAGSAVVPDSALQMILVLAPDWSTPSATVYRFERISGEWKTVGTAIPAVIGKNGMAWGIGLHRSQGGDSTGSGKREGDLKAPAGVFALGESWGYADRLPFPARIPYHKGTESTLGIDDTRSVFYNRIIDTLALTASDPRDWRSCERMRRKDQLYTWLVVIRHNPENQKDRGSQIFLHVWRNPQAGTAGCTAMAEENVLAVLRWLDSGKHPVIVQLPLDVYERVSAAWMLPGIPGRN